MGKDRRYVRGNNPNGRTRVQGCAEQRGQATISLLGHAQTLSLRLQEQTALLPPIGTCLQGKPRGHMAPEGTKAVRQENSIFQEAEPKCVQKGLQVFRRTAQGLGAHRRRDHRHRLLQDKGPERPEEQLQPEQDRPPYRVHRQQDTGIPTTT